MAQFQIYSFGKPYAFHRNGKGDRTLFYSDDDIPSKVIESKMTIESFFVEINLRKKKLLLCFVLIIPKILKHLIT